MIKSIARVFDNFFFHSFDTKSFILFKTTVYLYVFFFIGYNDFSESPLLNKDWDPVSFFSFMNLKSWFVLASLSFYLLKIGSVLSLFDRCFGVSSKICFFSTLINLGFYSNFGKVFHGFHFLVMTLALLSLVKIDREVQHFWPLQLLKIYAVLIYFTAALNKMIFSGWEWIFSENLLRIVVASPGKTWLAYKLLELPVWAIMGLAFYVVFIVQFLSVSALVSKKLAIFFFINASLFHIGVQLTLGGHVSFLSHIICLFVFLPLPRLVNAMAQIPVRLGGRARL